MIGLRYQLAFALLLVSLSFAYPAGCGNSVERYLEPGEKYSLLSLPGGYVLFSIQDRYSMLAECGTMPRYLTDQTEIEALLSSYAGSANSSSDALPDEAWLKKMGGLLSSFSSSRAKESVCRLYTGTDRAPCSDLASCFKACSTPLCEIKYGSGCELRGNEVRGCDFIEGVLGFSKDTAYLDSEGAKLQALLGKVGKDRSTGPLDQGIASAQGMLDACGRINSNALMRTNDEKGYYFCPKVLYDEASLQAFKDSLIELRNRYSLIINPDETSKQIAIETGRRIELRDDLDRCAQNVIYVDDATAGAAGSGGGVANYSEVLWVVSKLAAQGGKVKALCQERNFANASLGMQEFRALEGGARQTIADVSAEYSEVMALYSKVAGEISALPPERNATALLESMRLVERELAIVRNSTDLAVLKKVLLENERKAGGLSAPSPGFLEQAGLPLALAVIVTVLLYYLMRKTRGQGL